MAERRAFLMSPLSENKPSTGTEDAGGIKEMRARTFLIHVRCFFQNVNGDSFSSSVSRIGERYAVISQRMAFS